MQPPTLAPNSLLYSEAKHTFNRAVDETVSRASSISNQRAGEYSDSWSLDNLRTPWVDNLLADHPLGNVPTHYMPHFKRLLIMASMLDIKLSRLAGGWKDDTALDSLNYLAAYTQLRNEFESFITRAGQTLSDGLLGLVGTSPQSR